MKFNSTNEAVESFFSSRIKKTSDKNKSYVDMPDREEKTENKNEMLSILQSFVMAIMNNKTVIFLSCLLVFALMLTYGYSKNSLRANARLSLNYEQASSGLYPNGTHFNIYDICSDEVLGKAIEYAGLTDEDGITPSMLKSSISITAPTSKSADNYIATSYTISFTKPKEIKNITSVDMLSMICRAYKDYFFTNFAGSSSVLKTSYKFSDTLEYDEICQELFNSATQTQNYVDMRVKEGKTFTASDGSNFNSLNKEVQSILDYDLTDLNAYIWENGVLKAPKTYINTLKYKNYTLNKEYKTYMIEYNDRMAGIDKYNEAMTASVLIPTYNTAYEFYMSRTKNGVDYLADNSDAQLTLAEEVDRTLLINEDKISKATGAPANATTRRKAESMIEKIESKLSKLTKRIKKADTEYKIQKTKNYLTLTSSGLSTLQIFGVSEAILFTLAYLVVLIYALHLPYSNAVKKLMKRRKKK